MQTNASNDVTCTEMTSAMKALVRRKAELDVSPMQIEEDDTKRLPTGH